MGISLFPTRGTVSNPTTLFIYNISRCVSRSTLHTSALTESSPPNPREQASAGPGLPQHGNPLPTRVSARQPPTPQTALQAIRPSQTNTTGGKLVRRYNTPSSTKVLPKRSAGQTHQTSARPKSPIPTTRRKPTKTAKRTPPPPLPTIDWKAAPHETAGMKHSITGHIQKYTHTQWTRSNPNKNRGLKANGQTGRPKYYEALNSRPTHSRQHIYKLVVARLRPGRFTNSNKKTIYRPIRCRNIQTQIKSRIIGTEQTGNIKTKIHPDSQ